MRYVVASLALVGAGALPATLRSVPSKLGETFGTLAKGFLLVCLLGSLPSGWVLMYYALTKVVFVEYAPPAAVTLWALGVLTGCYIGTVLTALVLRKRS